MSWQDAFVAVLIGSVQGNVHEGSDPQDMASCGCTQAPSSTTWHVVLQCRERSNVKELHD
jgi:hypothetical protein